MDAISVQFTLEICLTAWTESTGFFYA